MSASLRHGLASLPDTARAAIIFLADMPLVSSMLATDLLSHVLNGAPAAIASYQDRPAHPVAIARDIFPMLDQLEGDKGARAILESMPGTIRIATEDSGNVFDVDRPADLS